MNFLHEIAMYQLVVFVDMVAFARAQAKSIFSRLRILSISAKQFETNERERKTKKYIQKEKISNHFLEAIKSGGIWLS